MKRYVLVFAFIIIASGLAFAEQPAKPFAEQVAKQVTLSLDKAVYKGGETIKITGMAPPGMPIYIEIASVAEVQVSRLDRRRDPVTGKIPYIFYLSRDIPAVYKILMPREVAAAYEIEKAKGGDWSVSRTLKETGAGVAFMAPAEGEILRWQASVLAMITGSRGYRLEPMDKDGNRRQSMPLIKTRFRDIDKVFSPTIVIHEDGRFEAEYVLPNNAPTGAFTAIAVVDKDIKSAPVTFTHDPPFGHLYFARAGQTLNALGPLVLAIVVCTFGVTMGAGGGFILNPLLIFIYGIPHAVVAGSVLPSVLFSQGSGIYNYSKIQFINWKLGIGVGLAMLAGGWIGPVLTQMITLAEYKFLFGWVLLILAGLMLWQTTPGYIAKNKKESAILKEYMKRAQELAAKRAAGKAEQK